MLKKTTCASLAASVGGFEGLQSNERVAREETMDRGMWSTPLSADILEGGGRVNLEDCKLMMNNGAREEHEEMQKGVAALPSCNGGGTEG